MLASGTVLETNIKQAFRRLTKVRLIKNLPEGHYVLNNFINILFRKEQKEMDWLKLSPKEKQEMMTSIEDMVLERVSTERRLNGLDPDDIMKRFHPEDRLKGIDLKIIEAYLNSLKSKRR